MDISPLQPVDLNRYLAQPSCAEIELSRLFASGTQLVIFDIGACEGEESIRYARRFPNARIFSFEPLPENQRIINMNFTKHKVAHAELVPLALSNVCGPAEFNVSSGKPTELFSGETWNYGNKSSSLLPPSTKAPMHGWIEFKRKVSVQCQTLDGFCKERGITRIDFVHMDVQGAEALVLDGAQNMLSHITALWLEVSDQELYQGQKLRGEIEHILQQRKFKKTKEVMNGVEGDHFYVNLRHSSTWRYAAEAQLSQTLRKIRSAIS